jgi:transcriptional regulator with XRE-family HTH domain
MAMTRCLLSTMETLGPLVRTTRLRKGIRATDLAYQIGKDPSYLSKLERDLLKETPSPETIHALAEALGLSSDRLLKAMGYAIGEPAEPAPDDPLAALIATFTPRQREMLLTLLDQANARALVPDPVTIDPRARA